MQCTECFHNSSESSSFCENCGRPFYTPKEDERPLIKNRYRVISVLAEGGMGDISLAYDVRLNKTCAIKKILSQVLDNEKKKAEITSSFKREAELLAKLRHPNLPCVTDYFVDRGLCYLVMDYIEGRDFEMILEEEGGGLPEKQVIEWSIQICRVLEYLHGQSIPVIHGDLKSANLIEREADGWIMLVDFGSAIFEKLRDEEKRTPHVTIGYAPPEQYEGKVESRSDIYSLGATMYELLGGTLPEEEFKFSPIGEINSEISAELEEIIMKCLEIKPEDRFNKASDLKQKLLDLYKSKFGTVDTSYETTGLTDETEEGEGEEENINLNAIKVFIVDDEFDLLETFTKIVKLFKGIHVTGTAQNGKEALELVKKAKTKPDVIMMDIDMPFMDGITATREIRKLLPDMKIVIMTTHLREETFFDALDAGATGYMIKGETSWEDMEETIKKAFNGGVPISSSASPFLIKAAIGGSTGLFPVKEKEQIPDKLYTENKPPHKISQSESSAALQEEKKENAVVNEIMKKITSSKSKAKIEEIKETDISPYEYSEEKYDTNKLLPNSLLEFQEAWAYNALGNKYCQGQEKSLALSCYAKALEIDPHYLEVHFNIARLILEEWQSEGFKDDEKLNEAMFHLDKCIEIAPGTSIAEEAEKYIIHITGKKNGIIEKELEDTKKTLPEIEIEEEIIESEIIEEIEINDEEALSLEDTESSEKKEEKKHHHEDYRDSFAGNFSTKKLKKEREEEDIIREEEDRRRREEDKRRREEDKKRREEDRRRREEDKRRREEDRRRENILLQKEEELVKRENKLMNREEELLNREEENIRREEEIRKREEENIRREEGVRKREDSIRKREDSIRRREEDIRKREDSIRRREEDVRRQKNTGRI